jgi:hypothetical protein
MAFRRMRGKLTMVGIAGDLGITDRTGQFEYTIPRTVLVELPLGIEDYDVDVEDSDE